MSHEASWIQISLEINIFRVISNTGNAWSGWGFRIQTIPAIFIERETPLARCSSLINTCSFTAKIHNRSIVSDNQYICFYISIAQQSSSFLPPSLFKPRSRLWLNADLGTRLAALCYANIMTTYLTTTVNSKELQHGWKPNTVWEGFNNKWENCLAPENEYILTLLFAAV